ncbi:MAG: PilX N-terminal domain-containing pilus assembly protein [Gemmatimonadaceae bacterium]
MTSNRTGFALVTATLCIVLITVLAVATMFAGSQEARASGAALTAQKAFAYAEYAAILAVASWNCPGCDSLPIGTVLIRSPAAEPPLHSTVYTTRLDSGLFVIVGEGRIVTAGVTQLARRVSITIRVTSDSAGGTRALPLRPQSWGVTYKM